MNHAFQSCLYIITTNCFVNKYSLVEITLELICKKIMWISKFLWRSASSIAGVGMEELNCHLYPQAKGISLDKKYFHREYLLVYADLLKLG